MPHLWTRLHLDLTAHWKRTSVLGVLFVLGCGCWVPLLLRASPSRDVSARAESNSTHSQRTTTPLSTTPNSIATSGEQASFWQDLADSLEHDPLFHPADTAQLRRDPFTPLSDDSAPATSVVADRPATVETVNVWEIAVPQAPVWNASPTVAAAPARQPIHPAGLELRSTMVSRTRRVAIINGQMYHQGTDIIANGQRYRLTLVESHRVTLTFGDQDFVLTMPGIPLPDTARQNDEARRTTPLQP